MEDELQRAKDVANVRQLLVRSRVETGGTERRLADLEVDREELESETQWREPTDQTRMTHGLRGDSRSSARWEGRLQGASHSTQIPVRGRPRLSGGDINPELCELCTFLFISVLMCMWLVSGHVWCDLAYFRPV